MDMEEKKEIIENNEESLKLGIENNLLNSGSQDIYPGPDSVQWNVNKYGSTLSYKLEIINPYSNRNPTIDLSFTPIKTDFKSIGFKVDENLFVEIQDSNLALRASNKELDKCGISRFIVDLKSNLHVSRIHHKKHLKKVLDNIYECIHLIKSGLYLKKAKDLKKTYKLELQGAFHHSPIRPNLDKAEYKITTNLNNKLLAGSHAKIPFIFPLKFYAHKFLGGEDQIKLCPVEINNDGYKWIKKSSPIFSYEIENICDPEQVREFAKSLDRKVINEFRSDLKQSSLLIKLYLS